MTKYKRCQILLHPWQEEELKNIAARNGLSFSEVVRLCVSEKLATGTGFAKFSDNPGRIDQVHFNARRVVQG